MTTLPVAQIKESHDLCLDADNVPGAGATCVIPPYQAMNIGDRITLTWLGYFTGMPPTPSTKNKTLQAADLGQPVVLMVDQGDVYFSETADVSYSVKFGDGRGTDSASEVQTFTISPPPNTLLPPLGIKGYDGETPLNPGNFPGGLTLQIDPAYAGIGVGDIVLAYCTGARAAQSVIRSARVDQSTVDHGLVEVHVERQWLLDNIGGRVSLSYQYGQAGAALSSQSLSVDVTQPLDLPFPVVESANTEAEGKAWVPANTSGAYVRIPAEVTIPAGARVELHWQGQQEQGRHVATEPVSGETRRYFIPATAVAANMSADDSKRFPVFYRVTLADDSRQDSEHMNLRIEPLPTTRYPDVQCVQAQGNQTLSLSAVTAGADLYLGGSASPAWPFMAAGQLLTIEVTGAAFFGGETVSTFPRNAEAVTPSEFNLKKIEEKLAYTFLNGLKRNEKFSIHSKVSFDGGVTWQLFNINNKITLTN